MRLHSLLCLLCLPGLASSGCGRPPPVPTPTHVAVLALRSVGLGAPEAARLRREIHAAVGRVTTARLVGVQAADAAAARITACRDGAPEHAERCGVAVGRRLGASHVIVGAVGALGRTHVVQLRLIQVDSARVAVSVEETLFGELGVLLDATDTITGRLLAVSPTPPWYKRWWVWTLVGVGVTAAVVIPVVVSQQESSPYEPINLP